MVGMPSLPIRQDDDPWASVADHLGDFEPILPGVLNATVWNIERLSPLDAEDLRGIVRLALPIFRRAPGTHLTASEIEDAGALPSLSSFEQRAATGLFHIITVRGDRKNVERLALR